MKGLLLLLLLMIIIDCRADYLVDCNFNRMLSLYEGGMRTTCAGAKHFEQLEDALRYIGKITERGDNKIDLYELKPIQLSRVQTGTREVTRDVPTKVDEPVFEWVLAKE
jgi:hypothetical protein